MKLEDGKQKPDLLSLSDSGPDVATYSRPTSFPRSLFSVCLVVRRRETLETRLIDTGVLNEFFTRRINITYENSKTKGRRIIGHVSLKIHKRATPYKVIKELFWHANTLRPTRTCESTQPTLKLSEAQAKEGETQVNTLKDRIKNP